MNYDALAKKRRCHRKRTAATALTRLVTGAYVRECPKRVSRGIVAVCIAVTADGLLSATEDGMARVPTEEKAPGILVIRSAEAYESKQGPTYAGGISAETVGAQAIWLGVIRMPPGGRTKAHFHRNQETALFVISGEVDLWFGEDLSQHEIARAGDYQYVPAGVSHVAVNRSQTEPVVLVGARTDPNEQESVVLQPELDALVSATAP
jgi:uncharacterized RmlC-like cupin family protein